MTKTLAEVQEELSLLTNQLQKLFPNEETLSANDFLEKLIQEKDALEMALFEKRLENLKEFDKYREKLKELQSSELTELAEAKKRITRLESVIRSQIHNEFRLDDDIISLMVPFLFIALGSMVLIYSLPKKYN